MSVWNTPAADRVASLREQAVRCEDPGRPSARPGVLNAAYESVLREQIDTRDRYMGLLTSLRKHDEAVRTAAVSAFKDHADRYAQYAVRRHMKPFDALLHRAANLPDRPGPQQVEGLRRRRSRCGWNWRTPAPTGDLIDPGEPATPCARMRHVVGVLSSREGLDGTDVLRLVTQALNNEAPIRHLRRRLPGHAPAGFPAPATGVRRPRLDTGRMACGPTSPTDTAAHVKAYPLGEDWYMDLWSERGQLLAFGAVPETEVAALAPALTARAGAWSHDRSEYAWRRFADTAQATRTAAPPPDPPPAPRRLGLPSGGPPVSVRPSRPPPTGHRARPAVAPLPAPP